MKKIAIVFPDTHLAFSPTTLNLRSSLSENFDVKIISFYQNTYKTLDSENVIYLRESKIVSRVLQLFLKRIIRIKKYERRCLLIQKMMLSFYFIFNKYDHLIVVDLKALWLVQAVRKKNIHLLSLELTESTIKYKDYTNLSNLESIIIQNQERLLFLTDNKFSGRIFYIQNAPVYIPILEKNNQISQKKLIYCGTALRHFGILLCLDFLIDYPEYTLTIQGTVHDDILDIIKTKYKILIEKERLLINQNYLEIPQLINYTSHFRIGLCFYDTTYPEINNFNYWTAPSGKMFTYFAAGVPVIGNSLPGLDIITDFKAGVQINTLSPVEIKKGIDKIELNYNNYKNNSLEAAKHFDFDKNVQPFIEFLKGY